MSIVGQIIRDKQTELAKSIVIAHLVRFPEYEARYGNMGRQRCLEDASYHLAYLANAVQTASPLLFEAYVGWVKVLLNNYNIPNEDLKDFFETMKMVLKSELPEDIIGSPIEYIDLGLRYLAGASVDVPSYLTPEKPRANLAMQYLDYVLVGDRQNACRIILKAVDMDVPLHDIYSQVLEPVQYEIGRLWQMQKISVAQEHLSTAITQFVMSQLFSLIFTKRDQSSRMLTTCVGNEIHEVGLRMVADLCELAGWSTFYLGANTPHGSVIDALTTLDIDVLAISTTMGFHLHQVFDLIEKVRASQNCANVRIMVGGAPFNVDPDLWQKVGADGYASNAKSAVAEAERLIG